jgi:hypothetical protein
VFQGFLVLLALQEQHAPHTSHSPSLDRRNNIWLPAQINQAPHYATLKKYPVTCSYLNILLSNQLRFRKIIQLMPV